MSSFQRSNNELVEITQEGIDEIKKYSNVLTEETKPISLKKRDWKGWNLGSIWISILFSIPGYLLVSGFIASGMSWLQALLIVILGHSLVVLITIVLGHFGTKYGLSYTLVSKMTFGPKGNIFPTMIRAILGVLWFALQCWIGGIALSSLIGCIIPSFNNVTSKYIICFFIFLFINIVIAKSELKAIKVLSSYAMPLLIFIGTLTIIWAYKIAGGFGAIFTHSAVMGRDINFLKIFIPSLTAAMAVDGTVSLNMCDFTSHVKSQKEQILGQLVQIPIASFGIVLVSVCGTVASSIAFKNPIWSPSEIIARFQNPLIVIPCSLIILFVTTTINVTANLAPSCIILSNLWPKRVTYLKALLGIGLCAIMLKPWKMLASPNSYIFEVNGTLATFFGPMQGIYFASYWIENKTKINLVDIYRNDGGIYYYSGGWNKKAVLVLLIITMFILAGKFIPALKIVFDGSYIFGFIFGIIAYGVLTLKKSSF